MSWNISFYGRKEIMNKTVIWVDDIRDPLKYLINDDIDIIWCKSYDEFVKTLNKVKTLDSVYFDHDLGDIDNPDGEKTGYDCAKYLIDFCIDNNIKLPKFYSQSDNGPGRENIIKLLENYKRFECNN